MDAYQFQLHALAQTNFEPKLLRERNLCRFWAIKYRPLPQGEVFFRNGYLSTIFHVIWSLFGVFGRLCLFADTHERFNNFILERLFYKHFTIDISIVKKSPIFFSNFLFVWKIGVKFSVQTGKTEMQLINQKLFTKNVKSPLWHKTIKDFLTLSNVISSVWS